MQWCNVFHFEIKPVTIVGETVTMLLVTELTVRGLTDRVLTCLRIGSKCWLPDREVILNHFVWCLPVIAVIIFSLKTIFSQYQWQNLEEYGQMDHLNPQSTNTITRVIESDEYTCGIYGSLPISGNCVCLTPCEWLIVVLLMKSCSMICK